MCGGYSQIEATADAFLEPENFFALPDVPPSPFLAFGEEVHLVSYQNGVVADTPGYDVIRSLPSFCRMEGVPTVGKVLVPTIDLNTCVGGIVLKHKDAEQVKRDVAAIRQLEEDNEIFALEEEEPIKQRNIATTLIAKKIAVEAA